MGKSAGKAESFLQHLEPLQGALEAYARRSLYDPGELADALQGAIVHAYRDFDRYAEGTNFRAWIFRYLHFQVQNCNRKHRSRSHAALPEEVAVEAGWEPGVAEPLLQVLLEDPDPVLEQCDAALARAVRSMPELSRAVLLLHAIGAFKYREIAEILQVPLGTVMSSLSRSRLVLRRELVQLGEEQGILKRPAR